MRWLEMRKEERERKCEGGFEQVACIREKRLGCEGSLTVSIRAIVDPTEIP